MVESQFNSEPRNTQTPRTHIFTAKLEASLEMAALDQNPTFTLALTAEERTRSRRRYDHPDGAVLFLQLPRGTILQEGDWLQATDGVTLAIAAKPEPILTVRAHTSLALLQAAYHLGNRHVSLEIKDNYLRLEPDPVLKDLLTQRGLTVVEETLPFLPEPGAYHAHH